VKNNSSENPPDPVVHHVIQPQHHVTIVLERLCIVDPAADIRRVRSLKCLYMWKCGNR
jgi:hypothetical protein